MCAYTFIERIEEDVWGNKAIQVFCGQPNTPKMCARSMDEAYEKKTE